MPSPRRKTNRKQRITFFGPQPSIGNPAPKSVDHRIGFTSPNRKTNQKQRITFFCLARGVNPIENKGILCLGLSTSTGNPAPKSVAHRIGFTSPNRKTNQKQMITCFSLNSLPVWVPRNVSSTSVGNAAPKSVDHRIGFASPNRKTNQKQRITFLRLARGVKPIENKE